MWIYRPEDDNYFSQLAKCSDGDDAGECVIYFDPDDVPPSPAQGAMFAEALNVHDATGLTPSQLQARVAELETALNLCRMELAYQGCPAHVAMAEKALGIV